MEFDVDVGNSATGELHGRVPVAVVVDLASEVLVVVVPLGVEHERGRRPISVLVRRPEMSVVANLNQVVIHLLVVMREFMSCVSLCLSVFILLVYLFVCLSVCPSVCLSIAFPSSCLSVCLSLS